MTTATETTLALDLVRPHPQNVRISAVADPAMVESIRSVGIIESLLVAPDPDKPGAVFVIDGNRRLDGAARADLSTVPVRIREDLVTLAQQIEVMAITGLQKEHLSPVEEARAYEQLTLCGLDEDAIAHSTGFSVTRIRQRRRLTALSDRAQHAIHGGQASLVDVARLDEFTDDPIAAARLEEALGTPEFAYQVQQERATRARDERHSRTAAEWTEAGVRERTAEHPDVIEGYQQVHGTVEDLAKKHDGCLGFVRPPATEYFGPYLVCTDPKRHATGPASAPMSDWEKRRAEREERAARFAAAAAARGEWIAEHLAGLFPARGNGDLVKVAKALLPLADADTELRAQLVEAPAQSNTKVLRAFAAWVGQYVGGELDRDVVYIDDPTEARQVLDVWDWLTQAGYELSLVDREQRTLLETRFSELTDEAEDD